MLVYALVFLALAATTNARPWLVVVSPNLFHYDVDETVSVAVYDLETTHPRAQIDLFLQDYPNRINTFSTVSTSLVKETPKTLKVKVRPKDVPPFLGEAYDFVYLVARYNDGNYQFSREEKVRISYNNGLVLIQTDKPIYTPRQTVHIKVMPLGTDLKPFKHNVMLILQNPLGVRVQQKVKTPKENKVFIDEPIVLSPLAMTGNWTISALYGYKNTQNTSTVFEVKEYVLPTFGVEISGPKYILPDEDKRVNIFITARHTFNQPVQGIVRIKILVPGIQDDPITILNFATILRNGSFHLQSLKTKFLKGKLGKEWFPEGKRLRLEAEVTERATGKKERAVNSETYFTRTPFRVTFQNTPYYFKPGMPFEAEVIVRYPSGNPANGVPLRLSAHAITNAQEMIEVMKANDTNGKAIIQTDVEGLAWFTVDPPARNARSLTVTVKTAYFKNGFPEHQNTAKEFLAMPYRSKSNSFLSVDVPKAKVGKIAKCKVYRSNNDGARWISYFVVTRGKIIIHKTISRELEIGTVTSFNLLITAEMAPSARLVAYHIVNDNEIVADSTVIDTRAELPTKVSFDGGAEVEKKPDQNYELVIRSTAGTHIGIINVDRSVYLLRNKNRLTLKSVLKRVKSLDLGCGTGSGRNNRDVFENAGTTVVSNIQLEDYTNSGLLSCSKHQRRQKRSTNRAKDPMYMCCDAAKKRDKTRDCITRARGLSAELSKECKERFLNCCVEIFENTGVSKRARSLWDQMEDESFEDDNVRSNFPESEVFQEHVIGADGTLRIPLTLPSSITTWVFQAVALSNTTGLGLAAPLRVRTFSNFFIKLTLPPSVQRGEQVSVLATVYNFQLKDVKVHLYLKYNEGFCSSATPSNKFFKFAVLTVRSQSAASASFAIVPIVTGEVAVTVYARGNNPIDRDAVKRNLLVVPEGVQRRFTSSVTLDPWGVLKDSSGHSDSLNIGKQVSKVVVNISSDFIPESLFGKLYLNGEILGPTVQSVITGDLTSKLDLPGRCEEQTMSRLAPNVYVLKYLSAKGKLTSEIKQTLFDRIQQDVRHVLNSGYHKGTNHLKTWLTAYYQKVFCQLDKIHDVLLDKSIPCAAFAWLEARQIHDGSFQEQRYTNQYVAGTISSLHMTKVETKVALTSFVLISMQECQCSNQNLLVKEKATAFLVANLGAVQNPYPVAIATYALALANSSFSLNAQRKLNSMANYDQVKNIRYWIADKYSMATNVETTAYALLAQVAGNKPRYAGPIVNWLLNQRIAGGVMVSTQDTCVALQALSEYSVYFSQQNLNLRVEVNGAKRFIKTLTPENALLQHEEDITSQLLNQQMEFDVKATGTGIGQIQVEVTYNKHALDDELCLFDIQVEIKEKSAVESGQLRRKRSVQRDARSRKRGGRKRNRKNRRRRQRRRKAKRRKGKTRKRTKNCRGAKCAEKQKLPPVGEYRAIKTCTRYRNNGTVFNGIMDVVLPSGFTVGNKSLEQLKNNTEEIDDYELSDRSVLFYINTIKSSNTLCLQFDIKREYDVEAIQPVPVTVYSYYQPEKRCTKFHSIDGKNPVMKPACLGNVCKCSQGKCSSCNPLFGIKDKRRLARKACNEYDFVFRASLEEAKEKMSWLTYAMKVEKILKRGAKNVRPGEIIRFKKSVTCTCPDILKGKQYLIMGRDKGRLQYKLDGSTFVTEWSEGSRVLRGFTEILDGGKFCR